MVDSIWDPFPSSEAGGLFTNAIYGQLVQVVGDHIVVVIIIVATDAAKRKDIDILQRIISFFHSAVFWEFQT